MSPPPNFSSQSGASKGSVSLAGLRQQNDKVSQADAGSRRSLNALSITSDIVAALIRNPGPRGDHDSMVNAARAMLRSADQTTQQLVLDMGLKSIGWAKYRIMKMVTSAVATRWGMTSDDGKDVKTNADVSDLLPVWREIAKHDFPDLVHDEPADNNRVALQVSLLDAMAPVMREIAVFDMFHPPETAAIHARDVITAYAQASMEALIEPEISQRSRNQLLQSLLRNAGEIYASTWRRHAEDTVDSLKAMTKTQQTMALEMNPDGLPLTSVDAAFADSYSRLVEMVHYLSGPKPEVQAALKEVASSTPAAGSHIPPTGSDYLGSDDEEITPSSISASIPSTYPSFDVDMDLRDARVQSAA